MVSVWRCSGNPWFLVIRSKPVSSLFVQVTEDSLYFNWAASKQSKLLDASSISRMVIFQSCSMWQLQVFGAFRGQMDNLQSLSRFLGSSSTVTAPDWSWQDFKHCDTSGLASGQWSMASVAPHTDPSAALCGFPEFFNYIVFVFPEIGRGFLQHEAFNGSSAFSFVKVLHQFKEL